MKPEELPTEVIEWMTKHGRPDEVERLIADLKADRAESPILAAHNGSKRLK